MTVAEFLAVAFAAVAFGLGVRLVKSGVDWQNRYSAYVRATLKADRWELLFEPFRPMTDQQKLEYSQAVATIERIHETLRRQSASHPQEDAHK